VSYNIDSRMGGDSPTNAAFMEKCVLQHMKEGKDRSEAIEMCKMSLKQRAKLKDDMLKSMMTMVDRNE
jgi:hypothetical protein